ncbi:flagellar filament capping protein FliD [Viridibacillus sp. FSL E2-0187]|uniref:flagellar filament capping protein FliD n=1 Tax=Viridibacillus sp. FSL E2-0187 TaxID=2921362 RepID=UPI0030FD100E
MVNRVGGLASGMDIDALVEKLMTAERVPLNKLNQKKTTYEWQRDAYRAVNTKLKTFSDYLFDNFSLSSNFAKKTSTVTGVNSGKITVNAGSGASGTLDIQAVKQLATAAKTDIATANKTSHRYATETDSLDDINVTPGTITLNVTTKAADGKLTTTQKDITIEAGDSIKDFVDKLKSAGLDTSSYDPSTGKFKISGKDTSFTIDDQQSAEKLKSFGFSTSTTVEGLKVTNDEGKEVAASKTTDLNTLNISQGIYNFKVGDKNVSIEVKAGDTIESLLTELNKEGNGIKASYNETTGNLSISASKSGETVTAADPDAFEMLNKLGIKSTTSQSSAHTIKNKDESESNASSGSTVLGHLGLKNGSITLNVIQADGSMKETKVSYNETDSIDTFVKRLNSSGAGVTAIFSQGQMSIVANNTGKAIDPSVKSEIQIVTNVKDSDGNITQNKEGKELFAALGFISADEAANNENINLVSENNHGQNAIYAVNGLVMESQSNTTSISGYSLTLNSTFNANNLVTDNNGKTTIQGTISDSISVTSTNDINSMVDKVKEFVTKYNELIEGMNSQIKETKYREYTPLTAEQRKGMSESEQKLWDEKARSGLLRSDSIIRNGLSDMRNSIYGQVNGLGDKVMDTLSEMGITTSSSYNDGGKLVIDETKLRKALTDDPELVTKTFTQAGEKDAPEGDTRGIVQRLRESMSDFTKSIESKAGRATMTDNQYSIGKSLVDTDKRITTLTDRLKDVEARYWKQFSAMEAAINKANSQSSIFAQFGGQ